MGTKGLLVLYSLFGIVNVGFIIGAISYYAPFVWKYLCFLTLINLTISTVYIFARIYMLSMELLQKPIKEATKDFWHDHFYKYTFITNFGVVIVYWVLCSLGPQIMTPGDTWQYVVVSLYLHGVLCIFMLIEFLLEKHKHTDNHSFDFYFLGGAFVFYYCLLYICKYGFEYFVYPFLEKFNFQQMLVLFALISLINFNTHQLYHFLLDKRNKEETLSPNYQDVEKGSA